MEKASIVTYAGDLSLFEDLEQSLVRAIPKEATEWKRPFGRAVKSVFLETHFVPFSKDLIPKAGEWKLIGQPIFHTYWTECSDVETYKTTLKGDIEQWMKTIGSGDWMIVLVEVYDIRKSNKLIPRTTVMDKIRADFALKQGDRVLALIHPIKSESKSAESWRGLVNRLRVLLLQAYNKTLSKFEETVRANRECRPQPSWSYCSYFTMQEELALVLEMLGLHEEALVQYDELDALFTQFVLNSTKCEMPKWLVSFTVPLQKWAGPTLSQKVTSTQRELLRCSKLDLLQFRSYLFGRQSSLLTRLNKPWEVAQRALTFLHNCVQEMKILEVSSPDGAVATWVFLVCLEVLRTCEQFKESAQVEAYSQHTASLWVYARDKLKQLGALCGLSPGPGPTSDQLHMVVQLASGMGDPMSPTPGPTPVDRLKEALSSKEAYNSYFLELSELSISTYKHIGRMRSARVIGLDLAEFYIALNQPDKAATFLSSALQGFQDDRWHSLATSTQLKLVKCFSESSPDIKYTMCCASIAASCLEETTRVTFYHKFIASIKLFAQEPPEVTSLGEIGNVNTVVVEPRHLIKQGDCLIFAEVEIFSRLPGPLPCSAVKISVEKGSTESSQRKEDQVEDFDKKLPMFEQVDYKQDGSLHCANIVCREPQKALRRTDSQGRGRKISNPTRRDFTNCFQTRNVILNPGSNLLRLSWETQNVGRYILGQLCLNTYGLELLEPLPHPLPELFVEREKSTVEVKVCQDELLAGIPQQIELLLETGSYAVQQDSILHVVCADGLCASGESMSISLGSEFDLKLQQAKPFSKVTVPLTVLADLPSPASNDAAMTYKFCVWCSWCDVEYSTLLTFLTPLRTVTRLNSVAERKFLHVTVSGLSGTRLELLQPKLEGDEVTLQDLNTSRGLPLVIATGLNCSLLWELSNNQLEDVNLTFSVQYRPIGASSTAAFYCYKCHFTINSFKTLFVVRCNLVSGKDNDFCRVGAMCQLSLEVTRLDVDLVGESALMYEVFADQAMWAICGRAAGVMTLEKTSKQNIMLEVMPLIQGFLPLPHVRLSRYIPAFDKESGRGENSRPRLEAFSPGQVYSASKCEQVHVLPAGTAD